MRPLTLAAVFILTPTVLADDRAAADAYKQAGHGPKLDKDGYLVGLTFNKSEALTDADYAKLPTLARLRQLTFYGNCTMTDAQAAHVGRVGTLQELAANGTALSDAGFAAFANLKELRKLTVWHLGWQNKTLTGTGFAALAGCPKLERFNFSGSTVGDDGLRAVAAIPTLKELVFYHTRVTDAGLAYLKALPRLESVNVGPQGSMRLGDAGLAVLVSIPTLEAITFDETVLTYDGSLKMLKGLTNLKKLTLNKTDVSGDDLTKLKADLPGVAVMQTPPDEKLLAQMRRALAKK